MDQDASRRDSRRESHTPSLSYPNQANLTTNSPSTPPERSSTRAPDTVDGSTIDQSASDCDGCSEPARCGCERGATSRPAAGGLIWPGHEITFGDREQVIHPDGSIRCAHPIRATETTGSDRPVMSQSARISVDEMDVYGLRERLAAVEMELQRTEGDLAVAVREASAARAQLADRDVHLASARAVAAEFLAEFGKYRDESRAYIADHTDPRPTLAERQQRYLTVRQHTLSTAGLPELDRLDAEARYVAGEADELADAMVAYIAARQRSALCAANGGDWMALSNTETEAHRKVRHEIADVILAAATLAAMLPGDVTVEACIDEKTEADRGRG